MYIELNATCLFVKLDKFLASAIEKPIYYHHSQTRNFAAWSVQLSFRCLTCLKEKVLPVTASLNTSGEGFCSGRLYPSCTSFLSPPILYPVLLAIGNTIEMHLDIECYRGWYLRQSSFRVQGWLAMCFVCSLNLLKATAGNFNSFPSCLSMMGEDPMWLKAWYECFTPRKNKNTFLKVDVYFGFETTQLPRSATV